MIMENMFIYSSYRYILKDTCALKINENFDKLGSTKNFCSLNDTVTTVKHLYVLAESTVTGKRTGPLSPLMAGPAPPLTLGPVFPARDFLTPGFT